METRIRNLENNVSEIKGDFKLMNQTLIAISSTLSRLEEVQTKLHAFDMSLITKSKDIESMNGKLNLLLKDKTDFERKFENLETKVSKLTTSDEVQNVNIGNGERLFWIVASSVVGIASYYVRNGV